MTITGIEMAEPGDRAAQVGLGFRPPILSWPPRVYCGHLVARRRSGRVPPRPDTDSSATASSPPAAKADRAQASVRGGGPQLVWT
jgi:hypothetical protein